MQRDDDFDHALIGRYLADELTPDERRAFDHRLAADPRLRDELAELRRLWERAARQPSGSRIDAMWTRLSRRMHAAPTAVGDAPPMGPRRTSPPRGTPILPFPPTTPKASPATIVWRGVAALAAMLLLAIGVQQFNIGAGATRRATRETATRQYATERGQRTTFHLDDGSTVELGYASTLRVVRFTSTARELHLTGEAVFDVVHDSTRPFLVHAAGATTEDLGTRFGVRAYAADSVVRVVVVSGLVSLRPRTQPSAKAGAPPGQGTLLRPGQLGRLRADGIVDVTPIDTTAALGWLADRLMVHDATLASVAADLERRFAVTIRIPDSTVASMRVTANVESRSLDQLLDAVTVPLGLKHRRSDDAVLLVR